MTYVQAFNFMQIILKNIKILLIDKIKSLNIRYVNINFNFIMRHIYYEKKEIPIPEGAHMNRHDGAVRIYVDPTVPRRESPTLVIGKATSSTTMHPNDNFRRLYPALWEEYYGEKTPAHVLHYGMYLTALSAGWRTGLYDALHDAVGPLFGNALMDWAMYSILSRTGVASSFPEVMADQVLFSQRCHSDSWYSDLFCEKISPEDAEKFKDAWLKKVKGYDPGITDAWVAIDGSNTDCDMRGGDLPASGKAKSRRDGTVVGYMYAVDTRNGLPLTYDVFSGNVPDTKALMRMRNRLSRCGVKVRGAILDRLFCERPSIEAVESLGWDWVVMLKSDNHAHRQMMGQAPGLRWNLAHVVDRRGVFGVEGKAPLFSGSDKDSCVCLFYDGANGAERSLRLIEKVFDAEDDIRQQIDKGTEQPVVAAGAEKYLSVSKVDGKWIVERNVAAWQSDLDLKGYYSIASNTIMDARHMHTTYYLRDSCEKAYRTLGSQLGSDVTRVHSDRAILARHLAAFVAQAIRSVAAMDCRRLKLDTGRMLKEMDRLHISLIDSENYACVHDESVRQRKLLKAMGLPTESLDTVVCDINKRNNDAVVSQTHKMPELPVPGERRPRGREAKKINDIRAGKRTPVEEPKQKGKRGRPKGSKKASGTDNGGSGEAKDKSSKTKNQKAQRKQTAEADQPKRKPGRPKGSRNKKTLEREKKQAKRERRKQGTSNQSSHPDG